MMLNMDFVIRLLVAGILGTIIGLDREYRAKEAGYRTHFLVSLGSALIMIVSQYGFQEIIKESSVTLDPSRVAAQVVSGIGFIGAGTIIFQKQIVRGLTTAAGIWATAGIGLAVGAGMYTIGIAATVLTLVGLELLSYLFKSIGMKSSMVSFSTLEDIFQGHLYQRTHESEEAQAGYACTLLEVSDGKAKVDFHFGRGAKV